ncbi:hypothetical protein CJF30_00004077 [Rutstroemia sp. NJR-2017a BBW]|nr:hypothetical protein CJF30_00004077 [Rutstroemia sp. NJR-2017a BBW]
MRIRTVVLLAIVSILEAANGWADSALYKTLLPTVRLPTTRDPRQCVVANLTQYFNVPTPTGSLLDALNSYGAELIAPCTLPAIDELYGGCFPGKDDWCKFTTAAPISVLPDHQSYGSTASAWWAAHSSNAVDLAKECPNG